jgi:hypothetical protein
MITYKLVNNRFGNLDSIQRSDGWSIPIAPDNTDYQAYLKWVAEGNTPLPSDEVTNGN